MGRHRLTEPARDLVRMAGNLLATLKQKYPTYKAREWMNRSIQINAETLEEPHVASMQHVMFLLAEKIPRLARAECVPQATDLLGLARGILVGLGEMSLNGVYHASYE